VKSHEEKKSFKSVSYSAISSMSRMHKTRRRFNGGNAVKLQRWFDTWRWFLTLLLLYFFFGYILPVPALYLGIINPLYSYSWMLMWCAVAITLAYREVMRRASAMAGKFKVFYNPNALKEYLELLKKQGCRKT